MLQQWKNKHADGPLNAKKPKKVKERQKRAGMDRQEDSGKLPTTVDKTEDAAPSDERDIASKAIPEHWIGA